MYAAMGPATLVRIQLCAYLVSPAPQPTFIPWRRRWQPILRSRDLCWRSIIAVTDSPNTIAIPKTTRFESHLADLSAVLATFEITSAIFVGTSFGGVLAMMLAVLPPAAVAGVILNDIGPVMELRGLMRIKSYVGKLPIARNFEEGAEILRWLFEKQFTKLAPQDWIAFAQRTWREGDGTLVPSHDPKLARALSFSLEHLPTLWDQFDALARIPLMVIRGANSDMLARPTLNAMLARRDQLEIVVMPDQGHAPLLAEPEVIRRIAAFVASCDVPARD